jgi:hypothetical protein
MINQLITDCIQKTDKCIDVCELLINLNSEPNVFQWNKRTQETISFYNSMITKFEELIQECNLNQNDSIDCKTLIAISNEVIKQCKNMINQCGTVPSDRYSNLNTSKIQIIQNILPHAATCIAACEKFLNLYNN